MAHESLSLFLLASLPLVVVGFIQFLSHPGWKQAMTEEMAGLYSNGPWEVVALPPGKFPLVVFGFIQ